MHELLLRRVGRAGFVTAGQADIKSDCETAKGIRGSAGPTLGKSIARRNIASLLAKRHVSEVSISDFKGKCQMNEACGCVMLCLKVLGTRIFSSDAFSCPSSLKTQPNTKLLLENWQGNLHCSFYFRNISKVTLEFHSNVRAHV